MTTVNLKTWLSLNNIKQKQISKKLKVSPSYISQCVNGARNWSPKSARKLSTMLGLKLTEVFGNKIKIRR